MDGELIHPVELRHLVVDLDEAGAQIALIADEEQAGILFHALPPGRLSK
jgi:hypothetical protein